jgi:hypothetical protein
LKLPGEIAVKPARIRLALDRESGEAGIVEKDHVILHATPGAGLARHRQAPQRATEMAAGPGRGSAGIIESDSRHDRISFTESLFLLPLRNKFPSAFEKDV